MEVLPRDVTLYDPLDYQTTRTRIFDSVKGAVKERFPQSFGGVRMELADDLDYEDPKEFSPEEQKRALLGNDFLAHRLRGTINLYDDKTGELLDSKRSTLMNVPWMSPRGTFIHGGNEYTTIRQARLDPGPYGRIMDNGQVEVHFNAKPGTGSSMRVLLEPDTAQFRLRVGEQTGIHLYSVLRDMGVTDDDLKAQWGEGTWEKNQAKYNPRAFMQAYSKLVRPHLQLPPEAPMADRVVQLKEAFEAPQVLRSVAEQHLPHWLDPVKKASVSAALQKELPDDLAEVFQPDLKPDEMREASNYLYGGYGPRLASMKVWPSRWINDEVDPQGWVQWYEQFHTGRRSPDDARQIRRWANMKARTGATFVQKPSPRRAFALRNWAIDPLKLLPEESREAFGQEMQKYREAAWEQYRQKRAQLDHPDLQAIIRIVNNTQQAGLSEDGTVEELELALATWLHGGSDANEALMAASNEIKIASLARLLRDHPEEFRVVEDEEQVLLKHASATIDITSFVDDLSRCL